LNWAVDPLTFCFAVAICLAALLGLGDVSRSVRTSILIVAVAILVGTRVLFSDGGWSAMSASPLFSVLALTGFGTAFSLALMPFGSSFNQRYAFSLATLVAIGCGFAGMEKGKVDWIGLFHNIALVDIIAICLATAILGIADNKVRSQLRRLSRRSGVMLCMLCLAMAWTLRGDASLFGLSGWVDLWAVGSEILAAAVAWRVTFRWTHQRYENVNEKMGLFIAGVAASLGLMLVPVITSWL
jgi:hypothetical protein